MAKENKKIIVVCHNIRSALNVGSIFRTADGAGAKAVYLTGYTPAPPHAGISKTALGAELTVSWKKFAKIDAAIDFLKKQKFQIVALEQDKKSVPYNSLKPEKNIALILGNEVRGLNRKTLAKCDKIVEIPMRGKKESLNVAVAFGIAVYSFCE
jgi:23S rRNA (guanosine2251-2'-O)-methyltransferase